MCCRLVNAAHSSFLVGMSATGDRDLCAEHFFGQVRKSMTQQVKAHAASGKQDEKTMGLRIEYLKKEASAERIWKERVMHIVSLCAWFAICLMFGVCSALLLIRVLTAHPGNLSERRGWLSCHSSAQSHRLLATVSRAACGTALFMTGHVACSLCLGSSAFTLGSWRLSGEACRTRRRKSAARR